LTYEQGLELLKSFPKKPGDDWDRHCILVGEIAFRLARALGAYMPIDAGKVRLMGLVHDFGRSVSHCPYRHSYEGHKLLMKLGEAELARICTCHSNGTYKPQDLEEYGLKPEDFYVRTMEEKLIFISDNLECHGDIVRQEVRLSETIARYEKRNPEFVPVLKSKLEEFKAFDKEIRDISSRSVYEILGI